MSKVIYLDGCDPDGYRQYSCITTCSVDQVDAYGWSVQQELEEKLELEHDRGEKS